MYNHWKGQILINLKINITTIGPGIKDTFVQIN